MKNKPRIDGFFIEKHYGHTHYFNNDPLTHNQWAKDQGATHTLVIEGDMVGCGTRPLILKKTVAYVGVDELPGGVCKWDKWDIRNVTHFPS